MRPGIGTGLLFLLLTACRTTPVDIPITPYDMLNREIPEIRSPLQFRPPGLENGMRWFHGYKRMEGLSVTHAEFDSTDPGGPYAFVALFETDQTYIFYSHITVDEAAEGWGEFRTGDWTWGPERTTTNALGVVHYASARDSSRTCVFFSQAWRPTYTGYFHSRLAGHYCLREADGHLNAKAIVTALGHRRDAPLPANPGWREQTAVSSIEPLPEEATMVARWAGNEVARKGEMVWPTMDAEHGPIRFSTEVEGFSCEGTWKHAHGSYVRGGNKTGVWNVTCSDGRTAKGYFGSPGFLTGSGKGEDSTGKKITIEFWPSRKAPY